MQHNVDAIELEANVHVKETERDVTDTKEPDYEVREKMKEPEAQEATSEVRDETKQIEA